MLSYLLLDILKVNDTIKYIDVYSVSFPMPPQFINSVYGMTKDSHARKWKLFGEIYKSQKSLNTYRFKCWERLYAHCFKDFYAIEYHHVFSTEDWKSWILGKIDSIVPHNIIGDMKAVFKLSTNIYTK